MDIIVPQSDETEQAPDDTVRRLQHLLAEAITARSWAMDRVLALEAQRDAYRHWFIADDAGYCQACALPESNHRHAPRAAA